jgi:hypothetical protein
VSQLGIVFSSSLRENGRTLCPDGICVKGLIKRESVNQIKAGRRRFHILSNHDLGRK